MDRKETRVGRGTIAPACSISEEEGVVTLRLEMPGVPKEGLELRIEGNNLTVQGERRREETRGTYLVRERRHEPFRKSFTLDDSIDREKIAAELVDGMLTVTLGVKEAAKPRRIEIR